MSHLQDSVLAAIAAVSTRPSNGLKPEMELVADLGVDSAKALQLLIEIEERVGIEISDEEAEDLHTVADIVAFVERVSAG